MDRDDLVERVALEIGRNSPCEMSRDYARSLARDVLALIEPAVREECARIAETHPWYVEGIGTRVPGSGESRSIATAIRAGAKPS